MLYTKVHLDSLSLGELELTRTSLEYLVRHDRGKAHMRGTVTRAKDTLAYIGYVVAARAAPHEPVANSQTEPHP